MTEPLAQAPAAPAFPTPELVVLGAEAARAAAPTLRFTLNASEPSGREVYTIALTAQVNIEPARRAYDAETRERLVELFGEPERWGATTRSLPWARADVLVPSFTGATAFVLDVPCTYDLELAAAKYFDSLTDGDVPLAFHFNGTVLYRGDEDRLQVVPLAWSTTAQYRLPVEIWRAMMDAHYPGGRWIRLDAETLERLARRKAERGLTSYDAAVADLLEERA